jgi:hypothetical protein
MDINHDFEYDKNPFEKEVFIGKRNRYIAIDGLVGVADGGEMVRDKVYIKREQLYDKKKFIKLYVHESDFLSNMNTAGRIILTLLLKELTMGNNYVWMVWYSDYGVSRSTFSKGISNLVKVGLLAKSNSRGKYWLNQNILNQG